MSADGHIDDTSPDRSLLSNDADFDRVDDERALADAILVGATTTGGDHRLAGGAHRLSAEMWAEPPA